MKNSQSIRHLPAALILVLAATLFAAALLTASCSSETPNVFNCPVEFVSPQQDIELTGTRLDFGEHTPMGIRGLRVTDSLLIVQTRPMPHFYSYFRLDTPNQQNHQNRPDGLQWIGNGIASGRGPGEMLMPKLIDQAALPGERELPIYDGNSGKLFQLDLASLLKGEKPRLRTAIQELPVFLYHLFPYRDSLIFILNIIPDGETRRDLLLIRPGSAPDTLQNITLFPEVPCDFKISASLLHSSIQFHPRRDRLAIPMFSLPQLNLLDIATGERKTVSAVAPEDFPDWKKLANQASSDETRDSNGNLISVTVMPIAYTYKSYSSSDGAILLLYDPDRDSEKPSVMHLFDWDGNLLYRITVPEYLTKVAISPDSRTIYAITDEDEVFRYRLP